MINFLANDTQVLLIFWWETSEKIKFIEKQMKDTFSVIRQGLIIIYNE